MDATGGAEPPSCAECGSPLPGSPKFCPECGARVTTAPAPLRKTVTLLFTDVTGSTALGEQLDPEAYRGIMGRYFEVARRAIERHGGALEKFVGDAVLAVFGMPEVREDDALRAVRAAVELNREVRSLSDELAARLGVRLDIRTGINTGAVVTGASRAGGSFATGDAVNTAARLEQAAPSGAILLGAETWELVRDAVEVEPVLPLAAKGKAEPLPAYRLVRLREDMSTGRARRTDTALMGRQQEIRVLDEALERTVTRSRSHLVTVVGAPGMGKSRLLHDWAAGLEDRATVARGRCVSYGQGITYWPIMQVLREAIGLSGHETEEATRHALLRLMGSCADAEQVSTLLLPLLGQSGQAGDTDRTAWAVRRALEQLATRRPLVVTVDDLHWAEPTLLELLERVRDEVEDLPLLFVCQARPELLDQHPEWGGSVNSVTLGLEPLTTEDVSGTLGSLLGGPVDERVAREVAERAGGNPLFVEEIVAHLVDLGLLASDPTGRWSLTGELTAARIPPTVSALLAARLDRLPPEERSLLERASVVGLEFTAEEAEALAGRPVRDSLGRLARRDLLRRVRGPEGDTWQFKHMLVRDAAYETLPKATRAELHELMADRIEADTSAAGVEGEAFMAHHLEVAVRCRRELAEHGPALDDLADRAVACLLRAGSAAADRLNDVTALGWFRRAVDLQAPSSATRRRARALLANSLASVAQVEAGAANLAAWATELADATPLEVSLYDCLLLTNRIDRGEEIDPQRLIDVARETADLARQAGDRSALTAALQCEASAWMERAQFERARGALLELVDEGGASARRYAVLTGLGIRILGPLPFAELRHTVEDLESDPSLSATLKAVVASTRAVVTAATTGPAALPEIVAAEQRAVAAGFGGTLPPHNLAAMSCSAAGLPGEAARHFAQCVEICERLGDPSRGSTMLAWQLSLLLEMDEDVTDEIRRKLEVARSWTSPYDVMAVAQVSTLDALIAARDGDLARAQDRLEVSIATLDESDQVWPQADQRRWLSEVARRRGDREAERRLLTEARDLYLAKGMTYLAGVVAERLHAHDA